MLKSPHSATGLLVSNCSGQPTTWSLPVSCENTVLLVSSWLWCSIGRDAVFVCDSGQMSSHSEVGGCGFLGNFMSIHRQLCLFQRSWKGPGVHFVQNSCMRASAVRACSPEQQTIYIKCLMVLGGLWHHHWRWKTVGDETTPCRVPCPSSFFQFFCSCGHSCLGIKIFFFFSCQLVKTLADSVEHLLTHTTLPGAQIQALLSDTA